MSAFVDRAAVEVTAGDGGNGCASVRREKFVPLGGPDGGNGGRGGSVVLRVDPNITTLLDFHYRPHAQAGSGRPGQGNHRSGADGADLVLQVPDGTVVVDAHSGEQLADLIGAGREFSLARGGRGGLGNAALAGPRRKVPGFALLGEAGEHREVVLELKSVADVALVGFPNAGKSSLVAALSAARPKIADYPFTTLVPQLGVVDAGEGRRFTVADVPGLIAGASDGRGLGLEFLRHIERCAVIVHVLDCGTEEPGRDPVSDLELIEAELTAYGGLADRPRLVALSKVDLPEAADLADLVGADLRRRGFPVFAVSAVSHAGLRPLVHGLVAAVLEERARQPLAAPAPVVVRPRSTAAPAVFQVVFDEATTAYQVHGDRVERWISQTDFTNDEAVGFLADRLAKAGVEAELARVGAHPGDAVTIGGVTFDWQPTLGTVASLGPRGTDERLGSGQRISRTERNARRVAARDAERLAAAAATDAEAPSSAGAERWPGRE